ncbi:retrovirus-related pol polyprotein from transposon TNT 1-94 [Tanacetum coccineum]
MSKAKRSSFKSKAVPSSKGRLNLLHMDLCGPMRVASINGKKYILVIVDDYSRYTWTLFLRSKDETPEVLKDFLTMIQRNLQAQEPLDTCDFYNAWNVGNRTGGFVRNNTLSCDNGDGFVKYEGIKLPDKLVDIQSNSFIVRDLYVSVHNPNLDDIQGHKSTCIRKSFIAVAIDVVFIARLIISVFGYFWRRESLIRKGNIGEWRFDKGSHLWGPPPKILSSPPPGVVPEPVERKKNSTTGASIDGYALMCMTNEKLENTPVGYLINMLMEERRTGNIVTVADKEEISGTSLMGEHDESESSLSESQQERRKKRSAVGKPDYLAPEILLGTRHEHPQVPWSNERPLENRVERDHWRLVYIVARLVLYNYVEF